MRGGYSGATQQSEAINCKDEANRFRVECDGYGNRRTSIPVNELELTPDQNKKRLERKYDSLKRRTWKKLSPAARFEQAMEFKPGFQQLTMPGMMAKPSKEGFQELINEFMKGVKNKTPADKARYRSLENKLRRKILHSDTTRWAAWAKYQTGQGNNVYLAPGSELTTRLEPQREKRIKMREEMIKQRGYEEVLLSRGNHKRVIMIRSEDYVTYPNSSSNINVQLEEAIDCVPREQEIVARLTSASIPNTFYQVSNTFRNRFFCATYTGDDIGGTLRTETVRFDLGPGTYTLEQQGNTVVSTLIERLQFLFHDFMNTPAFGPGAGTSTNWTIGSIQSHYQYEAHSGGTVADSIIVEYNQPRNRLVFKMRQHGAGAHPNLPNGYWVMLMDPNSAVPQAVGLPPTDVNFPRLLGLEPTDGDGPPAFVSNSFSSDSYALGAFDLFGPFSAQMYHSRELLLHLSWANLNYVNVRKDVPNRVSTILGILPVDQAYGKLLALPARVTRPEVVINQTHVTNVNVFLTDGDGDPIDFNGQHWSATIELEIRKVPPKVVKKGGPDIQQILYRMKRFDVLARMEKNDVVPPIATLKDMQREIHGGGDGIVTEEEAKQNLINLRLKQRMRHRSDSAIGSGHAKAFLGGNVHTEGAVSPL